MCYHVIVKPKCFPFGIGLVLVLVIDEKRILVKMLLEETLCSISLT